MNTSNFVLSKNFRFQKPPVLKTFEGALLQLLFEKLIKYRMRIIHILSYLSSRVQTVCPISEILSKIFQNEYSQGKLENDFKTHTLILTNFAKSIFGSTNLQTSLSMMCVEIWIFTNSKIDKLKVLDKRKHLILPLFAENERKLMFLLLYGPGETMDDDTESVIGGEDAVEVEALEKIFKTLVEGRVDELGDKREYLNQVAQELRGERLLELRLTLMNKLDQVYCIESSSEESR